MELVVAGATPERSRTATHVNGGSAPTWGEPAGNGVEFIFECEGRDDLTAVEVIAWDDDQTSRDDRLGAGSVEVPAQTDGSTQVVALRNKRRKPAGEVHLVVSSSFFFAARCVFVDGPCPADAVLGPGSGINAPDAFAAQAPCDRVRCPR